jgi:NADH-quinone oxidoreductase subunit J
MDFIVNNFVEILFYALAGLIIAAAIGVISFKSPVHSALSLLLTFLLVAALFILRHAEFLAAVQVLVYAGGILVLFLFVIMLLNLDADLPQKRRRNLTIAASIGGVVFTGVTLRALFLTGGELPGPGLDGPVPVGFGSATAIGERLFTHFVLPFEITSVLLLVAVLGAVVLAKKKIS